MDILYRVFKIKRSELVGALLSFLVLFILMSSAFVIKIVRDSLPSDWGDVGLAKQWSVTFILSTIAVVIYNLVASKLSVKKLLPTVFIFFAASFVFIYALGRMELVSQTLLGKIFYAWVSVFSLYHISVFWGFMSQSYTKSESKRVFSFINTGASAGAIAGFFFVKFYKDEVSVELALVIVVLALVSVLPLIGFIRKINVQKGVDDAKVSGNLSPNPLSGITELFGDKTLRYLALFFFFFTGVSTFLYVFQTEVLSGHDIRSRQGYLAYLELAINIVTILLGIFATSRITQKFGLKTALSIVPFCVALALLLLSLNPTILFVLAIQFLRKSANYSITRPSREAVYTIVSREAKFRTKPIIDVAIYRGGDVFWAWFFVILGSKGISFPWIKVGSEEGFTLALNLSTTGKLCVGAGIAVIWGIVAIIIGKHYEKVENDEKLADKASETNS